MESLRLASTYETCSASAAGGGHRRPADCVPQRRLSDRLRVLVKTKKPVVGCCSAHCKSATDQLVNTGRSAIGLGTGGIVVEQHHPPTLLDLSRLSPTSRTGGWSASRRSSGMAPASAGDGVAGRLVVTAGPPFVVDHFWRHYPDPSAYCTHGMRRNSTRTSASVVGTAIVG